MCSRGFLREPDGTITSIDVPGATVTQVRGINDAGQMVVLAAYFDSAVNSFTYKNFIYDGTSFETIEVPGAYLTQVARINNAGVIVGRYVVALPNGVFENHAFVARREEE